MVDFVTDAGGKTFLDRGLERWSNLHDKCQSGKPALALRSLGDRIFISAREGDHFDIGKHAVCDVD